MQFKKANLCGIRKGACDFKVPVAKSCKQSTSTSVVGHSTFYRIPIYSQLDKMPCHAYTNKCQLIVIEKGWCTNLYMD